MIQEILFTIGYNLDPPTFGAHTPNVGRWSLAATHPAASVGTNVVSSLLNAMAVLCFCTYYVRCRQWVTAHPLLSLAKHFHYIRASNIRWAYWPTFFLNTTATF